MSNSECRMQTWFVFCRIVKKITGIKLLNSEMLKIMKRIFILFLSQLVFCCFIAVNVFSQNDPDFFVRQLPPVPLEICGESSETIESWHNQLSPKIDRMKELLSDEKIRQEDAIANGKGNQDFFNSPALQNKYKDLLDKVNEIQIKTDTKLSEISLIQSKAIIAIADKYIPILEALKKELQSARSSGKQVADIKEKTTLVVTEKCIEMSVVNKKFATSFCELIPEVISSGIRINKLRDEANKMLYTNYHFETHYGTWMDYLVYYSEKLYQLTD